MAASYRQPSALAPRPIVATPPTFSGSGISTTGPATGEGTGALAIGALNFGDETTGPAAGGSPSASDRVVRIRWRR